MVGYILSVFAQFMNQALFIIVSDSYRHLEDVYNLKFYQIYYVGLCTSKSNFLLGRDIAMSYCMWEEYINVKECVWKSHEKKAWCEIDVLEAGKKDFVEWDQLDGIRSQRKPLVYNWDEDENCGIIFVHSQTCPRKRKNWNGFRKKISVFQEVPINSQ